MKLGFVRRSARKSMMRVVDLQLFRVCGTIVRGVQSREQQLATTPTNCQSAQGLPLIDTAAVSGAWALGDRGNEFTRSRAGARCLPALGGAGAESGSS